MELKKNPKLDLEQRRPLFFQIGLVIAIGLVIIAFEWRHEVEPKDIWTPVDEPIDVYIPHITDIPAPPLPKVVPPKAEIVQATQAANIVAVTEEIPIETYVDEPLPDEIPSDVFVAPIEEATEIEFIFSETMPSFPGGMDGFYEYLYSEIKYPKEAIRYEVDGKVFLSYVIDKDGTITQVKILKGIGSGCDEEAIRVLENSPKWSPGKQRGTPVRVRQSIAIHFQLD